MQSASEAQPRLPPSVTAGAEAQSGRGIARALRENALLAFPPEAFEEDVVARRFLGRQRIILNLPAAIQHVLVDNPTNYRRTAPTIRMLRPLLGRGLLLSDGEDWRVQRRTLAPAFAPRTVPVLAAHIAQATEETIARIELCGERTVDLFYEMQFLALEVAGKSMFSLAMVRHRTEMRELIAGYSERLGRPTLFDFLLPLAIPSPRDLARRRFHRRWMKLIARIIAERRAIAPGTAPDDLFDVLSEACDPHRLADQVATMITAGHETTAVALFWALYVVAMNPQVQQRLAAEVSELDFRAGNAGDLLPKLVYTRAVVQETLRLYPPAYAIVRQARQADVAGGSPLPAGAILFIAPWVLHRHRRLWDQPEIFDPDRFLPGATPPDRFVYLPFGIGPRVCIGAQFALTEATLVLAMMVKAFQIEYADPDPVVPIAIVTTQPDHPPLFRLHRRVHRVGS